MAPELAAAYVIGWIPSAGLSVLQVYLYERKIKKAEARQLQANLKKVNSYWAESQGKVLSLDDLNLKTILSLQSPLASSQQKDRLRENM